MKVLMINGSPKKNGNTSIALQEMEKIFAEEGIETEILHVGNKPVRGCIACGQCFFVELPLGIHIVEHSSIAAGAVRIPPGGSVCINFNACHMNCLPNLLQSFRRRALPVPFLAESQNLLRELCEIPVGTALVA